MAAAKRKSAPAAPTVTDEMRQLARESYLARQEEYAARRVADNRAEKLHALMAQGGVEAFHIEISGSNSGTTVVDAAITAEEIQEVDPALLREKADNDNIFLGLIKTSKDAVEKALGKTALFQVLRTVTKPPSLKIRARKV